MSIITSRLFFLLLLGLASIILLVSPSFGQELAIGNGVNLQPSYYNGGDVVLDFELMKKYPNIKSVRIEIEPSVSVPLAASWIRQAVQSGYQVIATYHKAAVLGSNDQNELLAAANWWKENYNTLTQQSAGGSFTVNLMNEWGNHQITSAAYAQAYNAAIKIVRQVYSGKIVIDAPGWGQGAQIVAGAITGSEGTKIEDTNIIPSMHIYPPAWNSVTGKNVQTTDIDAVAAAGRSLIIGEFGDKPDGSADWAGVVSYAKSKGYPVLGWAWNGDGDYGMNMVQPSWKDDPTASNHTTSAHFNTIYDLL